MINCVCSLQDGLQLCPTCKRYRLTRIEWEGMKTIWRAEFPEKTPEQLIRIDKSIDEMASFDYKRKSKIDIF